MQQFVFAGAILAAMPVAAQEMGPKDYSPSEEVPIKVSGVSKGPIGSRFLVSIGNRTTSAVTVQAECSMYDKAGDALGSEAALIQAVPPKSEAVKEVNSFTKGAKAVFCRVTGIRPAD